MIRQLIALFTRIRTAHQLRRAQQSAPVAHPAPRILQRVQFAINANQLDSAARALVIRAFTDTAARHTGEPDSWQRAEHTAVQLAANLTRKVVPLRRQRGSHLLPPTPPWVA